MDAWRRVFVAWRWSGRPLLIVDTRALVCDGPDAICLLAHTVGAARNQARLDGGTNESVQVIGPGLALLRLREQCLEEDLRERERIVLRLRESGMLYKEIAPHIGSSDTTTSRVSQVEQQGKQRLWDALRRRLAGLAEAGQGSDS